MLPATRSLSLLTLAWALACKPEPPADDFPGMRLLEQVEAMLERDKAALKPMLEHYGMVFPVEPADLDAYMEGVRVHGHGVDLALGDEHGLESHGGGILRLLFDHWRPDGRPPRLGDRYRFAASRRYLALHDLYEAGRQQLLLPGTPEGLPTLLVRDGAQMVQLDSYKLLSLLIEWEPDPARTWRNRLGQQLSVERLIHHVRAHYLAVRSPSAAPADHSELHAMELLVAFGERHPAFDLVAIQQHFLATGPARLTPERDGAELLIAHEVESLGRLIAVSRLRWSAAEQRSVRAWLTALERRFSTLGSLDLDGLCHLALGLRQVRAHRVVLR